MKIKGLERTANVAWSPQHQHPIYLVAGTAAQQLDASFSTTAVLELYLLNLNDPGYDMEMKYSIQSDHRFHKLTWGKHGSSSGTIVGGCDNGVIQIYNASKLLNGENGSISQQNKHKGSVKALDFNSFQNNLLASAASESEIYIWDLNNPSAPMTPGSKCQPLEDITSIAWNKQVQHILASTFPTKCVVWDLRKNDPIIKLTDTNVRVKWNAIAWNPDIPTQLCLGSEDDQSPIIQLWDLRFATSPLKIFESHQKGVLSISWCHQDTDMLLSCGRDNKIICWNPNNSEQGFDINCEFVLLNQWNFDVSWCPRNPALFVSSSFDGHVNIYSIIGGSQNCNTGNKIADSFPGMELFTQSPVTQPHSVPVDLKKPPKWLKKPIGAKFAFGGKLVMLENVSNNKDHEISSSHLIHISQVITERQLVSQSTALEFALQNGQYMDFCQNKIAQCNSNHEKLLWQFLASNFEPSPRTQILSLLGFNPEEIMQKLLKSTNKLENTKDNELLKMTNKMATLGKSTDSESELDGTVDVRDQNFYLDDDILHNTDKKSSFGSLITSQSPDHVFKISVGDDIDGLICQALLTGNIEAAVDLCLQDNRMADALILAMTGGSELLAKTQYLYFQKNNGYLSRLISAVVTEDWSHVIKNSDIGSWKEVLAATITHANEQEFPVLCEMLGERLENEKNGSFSECSELCYICAGNLNKFVGSWLNRGKSHTPDNMQELVELVMILKKALELQGLDVEITGRLASLLTNYAAILISQGSIETALSYLGDSNDEVILELKDRLNGSLGRSNKYFQLSTRQISSQPKPQKNRALSAGFYPPQSVHDDVVTAPPTAQHNFNLNPLQGNPASSSNSFTTTPYVPVPPMAAAAIPPPQSTAPPARAFPSPSSGSLSTRVKHVLDPSVQSTSSQPNYYSQSHYQPPIYSPQPALPTSNYGFNSTSYSVDSFNPPTNPTPPPSVTNIAKLPSVSQAPGWNDPPAVNSSKNFSQSALCEISGEHAGTRKWKSIISKSNQPKTEFLQPDAITQPLFGGPTGDTSINGQLYDPYQMSRPPLQQQQPSLPVSNVMQSYPGQQLPYPSYSPMNIPQPVMPKETRSVPQKPEPIKKPIPDEHLILQQIFNELRNKCSMAANNPQSKRKLDDVSKKLDLLYDNLREGRLTVNTLQNLHMMAQHVQAGDYTSGLMLHTQLVSGPDFSQIASFMPGIKVLLQSALQLQVYL